MFVCPGFPPSSRRNEQLIELQDQQERQQSQLQEEQDLRDIEEREIAIRQLEVILLRRYITAYFLKQC
jgi:hypothetical protein